MTNLTNTSLFQRHRNMLASLLAIAVFGACTTNEDLSSSMQHGGSGGSGGGGGSGAPDAGLVGSGAPNAGSGAPDAGSGTGDAGTGGGSDAGTSQDAGVPAQRCCSLHWQMAQRCRTDSSGLPVLATVNGDRSEFYIWNQCSGSYSSSYDGSANQYRCVNKNAQDVQPWGLQPSNTTYPYKNFYYSVYLGMVPDTSAGELQCHDLADAYRAASGMANNAAN